MLSWLFKKRVTVPAATLAARPGLAPLSGPALAASKPAPSRVSADDGLARLQVALGDDQALLQLAQSGTGLDVQLAAVQALTSEEALKQAERIFRNHGRKVHRLAKQRLEATVTQREARARADVLLAQTAALLGQTEVPVNHVVALDRNWADLPVPMLGLQQQHQFAALRASLETAIRTRSDAQQGLQRWAVEAERCLVEGRATLLALADAGQTADLAALELRLAAQRQSCPEVASRARLDQALAQTLRTCEAISGHLAWFVAPEHNARTPGGSAAAEQRWQQLAALTDADLALVFEQRKLRWQRQNPAPEPLAVASEQPARAWRPPRAEALGAEQLLQLESPLQHAEAAQADGQLGAMQQHLQAFELQLEGLHGAELPASLRRRHQSLRVESQRLKGWQRWGGGRARDELAAEAQALAARAAAATGPGSKLHLKAHAEGIQALRARWKDLDRHGAAAPVELWERFDIALRAAFEPVAAQQAVLRAARESNQLAREGLLSALESLPVPASPGAADSAPVTWRDLQRELDRFQIAWRQLGPLEHTVPSAAREAVQQRLQNAVARLEPPLQAVRLEAVADRESLIARAQAVLAQAGGSPQAPDAGRQVRELQFEWQEQARQFPLPRAMEGQVWTRFKAVTDAVFAQRDAAFAARGAELAANLAAAEALIERLSAVTAETPQGDIERVLSEVERAWRAGGPLPSGANAALEQRFDLARAAAQAQRLAASRRRWQAQCDRLMAQLAVGTTPQADEGRSPPGMAQGIRASAAGAGVRGLADAGLPPAWQQALAQRRAAALPDGPLPAAALDDALLQLEAALGLPAPPQHEAALRKLKLRALKDSLEGRSPSSPAGAVPADWMLALLRQGSLLPEQQHRLLGWLAALRNAEPGALGLPMVGD